MSEEVENDCCLPYQNIINHKKAQQGPMSRTGQQYLSAYFETPSVFSKRIKKNSSYEDTLSFTGIGPLVKQLSFSSSPESCNESSPNASVLNVGGTKLGSLYETYAEPADCSSRLQQRTHYGFQSVYQADPQQRLYAQYLTHQPCPIYHINSINKPDPRRLPQAEYLTMLPRSRYGVGNLLQGDPRRQPQAEYMTLLKPMNLCDTTDRGNITNMTEHIPVHAGRFR